MIWNLFRLLLLGGLFAICTCNAHFNPYRIETYNGRFWGVNGPVLDATTRNIDSADVFHLTFMNGGNKVRIQASNGYYVTAWDDGTLRINVRKSHPDCWETFTVVKTTVGNRHYVGLKTYHGWYISANPNTGKFEKAFHLKEWEMFINHFFLYIPQLPTYEAKTEPFDGDGNIMPLGRDHSRITNKIWEHCGDTGCDGEPHKEPVQGQLGSWCHYIIKGEYRREDKVNLINKLIESIARSSKHHGSSWLHQVGLPYRSIAWAMFNGQRVGSVVFVLKCISYDPAYEGGDPWKELIDLAWQAIRGFPSPSDCPF